MEDQDAGVQAQQVAVLQGRQQGLARHAGFAVLGHVVRLRDEEQDQQQADQRHPGGEPEQPMQAEQMGQHRAEHHGHGEGDADAHADHRHRLGPVLLAGEVGEQCHHRRRDRPGALQDAAGDHPQMESALAARAAPAAKISSPTTITGRRPMRSEMVPKGICRIAWVRP